MKVHRTLDDWTLLGSVFDKIGRRFLSTVFGKQLLLFFSALYSFFAEGRNLRSDLRNIIRQIYFTAVEVFPVLFVVSVLTGTVTIVEALTVMPRVGFSDAFGGLLVVVMVREIGPILTAFLVSGRSGSALTTMIGTMAINSEVDALATLGVNPVRYLVMPALLGGIVSMLLANLLFSVCGICGGFAVAKLLVLASGESLNLNLSWHYISESILLSLTATDFVMSILKPIAFGIIIFINACYHGLNIRRDIRQVPKATSRSVIYSFLFVIVIDVLFSLFYIFDYANQMSRII
ncbi:MAG: ABC transporter permease [Fibrobacter sp.]|nr:ABC transporter permease [Fibrobacter sp.]